MLGILFFGSFYLTLFVDLALSQVPIPVRLGSFIAPLSVDDLGRGFKSNNAKHSENAFTSHIFGNENVESKSMTGSSVISTIASDYKSLQKSMEISGSLSISYGPTCSMEGSGKYLNDNISSSKHINLIYRTRRNAFFKRLKPGSIELKDTLKRDHRDNYNAIIEKYGTKFISTIIYGAQLDITFTVTSETEMNKEEIEAKLKGNIGVPAVSVSFEGEFGLKDNNNSSKYNLHIAASSSGLNFPVPSNPKFEEVIGLINDFNEKYNDMYEKLLTEETFSSTKMEPVSFVLENTADYIEELDQLKMIAFERKMDEAGENFFQTLFAKEKLKQVNRDLDFKYESHPKLRFEMYFDYKIEYDKVIENIDKKLNLLMEYRAKNISEIVTEPVPEPYPKDEDEDRIISGLCGEYYISGKNIDIPSPHSNYAHLNNMHYTGFTRKSTSLPSLGNEANPFTVDDPAILAVKDNKGFIPTLEGKISDESAGDDTALAVHGMSPMLLYRNVMRLSNWVRVRHVPNGTQWHPSTDQLRGNDVYGDPRDDNSPWSIKFEDSLSEYNQFLFMSGNHEKWLILSRETATKGYEYGIDRHILDTNLPSPSLSSCQTRFPLTSATSSESPSESPSEYPSESPSKYPSESPSESQAASPQVTASKSPSSPPTASQLPTQSEPDNPDRVCQLSDICVDDTCLYRENNVQDEILMSFDGADVYISKDESGFDENKSVNKFENTEELYAAIEMLWEEQAKAEIEYGDPSTWDYSETDLNHLTVEELISLRAPFSEPSSIPTVSNYPSSLPPTIHVFANTASLKRAIDLWLTNKAEATKKYGHIISWDTSEITDMSYLFCGWSRCGGKYDLMANFNEDISQWDVTKVTDMKRMFFYAQSFNIDLSNWVVSQVTDMNGIFRNANLFSQNMCAWKNKVILSTDFHRMFYDTNCQNKDDPTDDNWCFDC